MAEEPNDGTRQRKTISTYDITTLDNPDNSGLLITQVQLRGENYDELARSLRTAFENEEEILLY